MEMEMVMETVMVMETSLQTEGGRSLAPSWILVSNAHAPVIEATSLLFIIVLTFMGLIFIFMQPSYSRIANKLIARFLVD